MVEITEIIKNIFTEALRAVDPYFRVREYAEKIHKEIDGGEFDKFIVIGFGKASYQMALAVEDVFNEEEILDGIIITKYDHARAPESSIELQGKRLTKIRVYEAAHPVPDENGLKAAKEILDLIQKTDEKTLVLCLISGGGSALFTLPYKGISFPEKQQITDLLMKAGADINELNAVRKHISSVKGGRFAEIIYPASVVSLIVSDVIGDKLDVIASGPTAPDTSTYKDALDVINKYGLLKKTPERIMDLLNKGDKGNVPDTPGPAVPCFDKVRNIIIGSNHAALDAAKDYAECRGFITEIVSSEITGEAKDVGRRLAEKAIKIKAQSHKGKRAKSEIKRCLIFGGETTVTVKGSGKGGRNTELALSFAMAIEGAKGITLLSAGTDGTDGPTDAAGAVVNGQTILKAKRAGLNASEYLDNNDSYNFFNIIDSLLITGPTGTNVMDVQIVLVE